VAGSCYQWEGEDGRERVCEGEHSAKMSTRVCKCKNDTLFQEWGEGEIKENVGMGVFKCDIFDTL
jgi:hypothetical protein